MTVATPMFPLGSVLFPHMPLQLRVFEERYVVMLSRILDIEPSEFGVVLIERGQEVGGGEQRFPTGTMAQITHLEAAEGSLVLVAEGARRVRVIEWLDDDPYPRAVVEPLPTFEWDDALTPLFERAEQVVRRALAVASEFVDQQWSANVEVSDDRVQAAWQLAAIAPLASLDQMAMLEADSLQQLLERVIELIAEAEVLFRADWLATDDEPGDEPLR